MLGAYATVAGSLAFGVAGCSGGSGGTESPPSSTHTLTVLLTGGGSGTVTGSGLQCGVTTRSCRVPGVPAGTAVTLTAAPGDASAFGGWSGCDTSDGLSCTVTMTSDRVVVATFASAGALRVTNDHCVPVTELYVWPVSGTWTVNELASPLPAGSSFAVTGLAAGTYAVQAVASDGVTWTEGAVPISAGVTYDLPLPMPTGTGCLRINNNTATTLYRVWLSPYGCLGAWGDERLHGATIANGTSFILSRLSASDYDVLADDVSPSGTFWLVCGVTVTAGAIEDVTFVP